MKHLKLFEQYHNDNFWKWFGNSKVVDKDGKPLVMYHGTSKSFDTFKAREHKQDLEGFYFTNSLEYAHSFAGWNTSKDQFYPATRDHLKLDTHNPNIVPVYLSVQNPLIITEEDEDLIEDIGYWKYIYDDVKQQGYDGVILEGFEQVFVFSPTQIKSAYGNNGNFDPNNPNMNEDYEKFKINKDDEHFSHYFQKETENKIRKFAFENNMKLGEIIGMGWGGVAFELDNDKVLKYTEDDIEVGASDFLVGKDCEYFANVYKIYDFESVWLIELEKLQPLNSEQIEDLKTILIKYMEIYGTYSNYEHHFGKLNGVFDQDLYKESNDKQRSYYKDLLNMKKEAKNYGFDLIDCKIANLGIKNGHLAMFDVKLSGF